MKKAIPAFALAVLLALSSHAWSHPGGTDAQGCHVDLKTGEHHCHDQVPSPPASGPCLKCGQILPPLKSKEAPGAEGGPLQQPDDGDGGA